MDEVKTYIISFKSWNENDNEEDRYELVDLEVW